MSAISNNNPKRLALIQAAHFALSSTCQLYQYIDEDQDKFVANGCAILFQFNSNYYCISNSHVLAGSQLGKTFFLLRDGTSMTLGGQLFHSLALSSENPNDDSLDFAIALLNENTATHLLNNGNKFLSIEHVLSGHNLIAEDVLMIAGYPASKTRVDHKTMSLEFNPLILSTKPYLRKIREPNFSKGFHHIVEFPINSFRETSTGQRMRVAKPHGISGSGLWLLDRRNLGSIPLLIGILSEYHEKKGIVISTKIDLFVDVIRQRFDNSIPNFGVQMDIIDIPPDDVH